MLDPLPFEDRPTAPASQGAQAAPDDAVAALPPELVNAVALTLNVAVEDLRGVSVDQLLQWLREPPSSKELAEALPAARASEDTAAPLNIPRELLASVAKVLNVPVRELEGANPETLLDWLDHPESFYTQRRARLAQPDPFVAPPTPEPLPATREAEAEAAVIASTLERFRSLRRQAAHERLGDRPDVLSPLLGRLADQERAEDAARPNVRPVPPPPARPRPPRSPEMFQSPDLMLIKSARAVQGTPIMPPRRNSLLTSLSQGLSRLFGRSSANQKKRR